MRSEGKREVCRWGWDGMRRDEGDEPTVLYVTEFMVQQKRKRSVNQVERLNFV